MYLYPYTKTLNLYCFKVLSDKENKTGFTLDYSVDSLFDKLSKDTKVTEFQVHSVIKVNDLIDMLEKADINPYIPLKLKERSFVNNLRYTKDFLIKDPEVKGQLDGILADL